MFKLTMIISNTDENFCWCIFNFTMLMNDFRTHFNVLKISMPNPETNVFMSVNLPNSARQCKMSAATLTSLSVGFLFFTELPSFWFQIPSCECSLLVRSFLSSLVNIIGIVTLKDADQIHAIKSQNLLHYNINCHNF